MSVVLLGPLDDRSLVGVEVARLRGAGRVGLITAGWQEWEDQDHWLREAVGGAVVNLELYRRAETVWAHDREFAEAHAALQHRVRLLRRAYNARLERAMDAWIALERWHGDEGVLADEREAARSAVADLDRHHLDRIGEFRGEFDARWRPTERELVARERHAVAGLLDGVDVVVVAGGHVPLLLNRLRLFDLAPLLEGRHVVAWSGGAMALTERIVLFHDSPPWGPGHAEVGEVGLGRVPGVVALPDGRRRLRLDDPGRVGRMARRFAPDACLVLDPGARAEWSRNGWSVGQALRLAPDGAVAPARDVA